MKNLQMHFEDFLEDSRDSEIFSLADRLHLEEEVDSYKEHFQRLLQSMENGEPSVTFRAVPTAGSAIYLCGI